MLPVLALLLLIATALPVLILVAVHFGGFPRSASLSQLVGYGTGFRWSSRSRSLLYTYLPNHRVRLSFGLPGAIFTAVAWEAAQVAFGIYTAHVNFYHVYGAVATFADPAAVVLLHGNHFLVRGRAERRLVGAAEKQSRDAASKR